MSTISAYERALAGYDAAFRDRLTAAIVEVIARESVIIEGETRVLAFRTGETVDALTMALATTLALSPVSDVPSRLRKTVEGIARKIRRDVAAGCASGKNFRARCFSSDDYNRGGHA